MIEYVVVVEPLSHVRLFATPWTAARQASLSSTVSQSLLKFMSIELVMPSNHLILCHPLLLLSSNFLSIRVFSSESALCIRWPQYWSSSFSISPFNEYSGLNNFRIDWLDLLDVQGTIKSSPAPQFKSINSLALKLFYGTALASVCITARKATALTIWIFVSKMMSLLFNTLSRFVIAFLPMSNSLWIQWL